jgi:hypothetical protein
MIISNTNTPCSTGRVTLHHAARQGPPGALSDPVQMKPRLILSMALLSHGELATAMNTCVGIAESVTLVSEVRPALDISHAFQVGSRSAIKSTKGWLEIGLL